MQLLVFVIANKSHKKNKNSNVLVLVSQYLLKVCYRVMGPNPVNLVKTSSGSLKLFKLNNHSWLSLSSEMVNGLTFVIWSTTQSTSPIQTGRCLTFLLENIIQIVVISFYFDGLIVATVAPTCSSGGIFIHTNTRTPLQLLVTLYHFIGL